MRSLSDSLKAAQQATSIDALVKIVLTCGASSYTYTRTRIIDIEHTENGNLQSCEIMLDNSDGALTNLDLKGYKGVLSFGAITASGEEYSPAAPMWVMAQRFDSSQGRLVCTLSLIGICNLMAEDKASVSYIPQEDDTKTIKTLINEIAGATLACFSHCTAYTVVWDSEDDLINTYTPKDSFRIYTGNNRLSAINRLLDLTKCVMRAQADGYIHIFMPTTTGTTYDYEYSLQGGHTFFAKALRNRLVIPNYVKVQSEDDDTPQYSGYAQDNDSYGRLPKSEFHQMYLDSDSQATSIAQAILAKAQMWCEAGSVDVPMNVGAEVYDYIKTTDARENDYRVGNIGKLVRHYTAGKNEWRMTFAFGNWQNVRKALADLGITSDDLEAYFSRLQVKDLYVEHILADNLDIAWIDPDGNIDLDKIGDNLDSLPDGEVYARSRSLHLDASGVYLAEKTLYTLRVPGVGDDNLWKDTTAPASPATGDYWIDTNYTPNKVKKWNGTTWVEVSADELHLLNSGTVVQRLKRSALTADGLVLMDEIKAGTYGKVKAASLSADGLVLLDRTVDGTYGKLKSTDISAGHILLSSYTQAEGEWYDEGGVEIDADHGINIYGTDMAFTTRATKTGTIQCYVGSNGAIYAGGGAVSLGSNGVLITGDTEMLRIRYSASTPLGAIFAESSSNFEIDSSAKLTLFAFDCIRLWGNEGIQLGMGLEAQGAYVNSLYDIYPYNTSSWLGNSSRKWAAIYRTNEYSCPLPTSNSAIKVLKKMKAPIVKDGDYGERHYFQTEDFPDEMKAEVFDKDDKGNLVPTGKKDIELTRVAGVTLQATREILERLEKLEAKVGM